MITGSALLPLLVSLVIAGLIFGLLWWFIGVCALPAPFDRVARVLVALVAVIYLIDVLMSLGGHPLVRW